MPRLLQNAISDSGIEQRQMHRDIGIFVNNVHKHIAAAIGVQRSRYEF